MGIDVILATILPLFAPVVIDGVKMIFSKFTGISLGEPKTFAEKVEWEKVSVEKLRALAMLDQIGGNISRWVADLRASFRYIAVGLIIIVTMAYLCFMGANIDKDVFNFLSQLSGSSLFFIIGDRVYIHLKK